MMEREEIVVALLKAAGGQLVGRVRLQKVVYLLDQLGLESGFRYDYHHYGPFSRDLDNAVADAEAFGLVDEKFGRRQVDGARYSIFKLTAAGFESPATIDRLNEAALGALSANVCRSHRYRARTRRHGQLAGRGRRSGGMAGGAATSEGTQGGRRPARSGLGPSPRRRPATSDRGRKRVGAITLAVMPAPFRRPHKRSSSMMFVIRNVRA